MESGRLAGPIAGLPAQGKVRLFLPSCVVRLASAAILALPLLQWAAPFSTEIQFEQPDGSVVVILAEGDEFYAHCQTLDGYTVVFDSDLLAYCYATLSEEGHLISTGVMVQEADPDSLGLRPGLRARPEVVRQRVREARRQWEQALEIDRRWSELKAMHRRQESSSAQQAPPTSPTVGTKVGLCVLVDFPDVPATIPRAEIEAFLNADRYTNYGNNGSVKQYFQDVSNQRLTFSNVVTVYVRVPRPKSYYNDLRRENEDVGNELVRDAIAALKALPSYTTQILPQFSGLTVDSQNRVIACSIFFAGTNSGVWGKGLWPHAWALYNVGAQELSPGGKKVWRYQITHIGTELELGTLVHEIGHLLCGFPDLYDYDYDSYGGAGIFCLMGLGNNGQRGRNPVQVCAYLKLAAGWATVSDLTASSAMLATLQALPGWGFNHFYRYRKPGSLTEYFLMECRYRTNRDAALPASGVAIWHIDELGDRDNQSRLPNTTHSNFEATLVQADNRWDLHNKVNSGDATDLWYQGNPAPGYANVFSDYTSPAARWWDGSLSGLYLQRFSGPGPTMEFIVGNDEVEPRIVSGPQSMTVIEGTNVALTVTAVGLAPLYYQWYRNGVALAGATTSRYLLNPVRFSDAGRYRVGVSNRFGVAWSPEAVVTVVAGASLADALDATGWDWSTDGDAPWYGQVWVTRDGVDAAVSGLIGPNQVSRVRTTVPGPCTLGFWWRVSSEGGGDWLRFRVNGVELDRISGEVGWVYRSFDLGAGWQELEWSYSKNGSVTLGQDRGWLDMVSVVLRPMAPIIRRQPQSLGVVRGAGLRLEVQAEGTPPLYYQWYRNGMPVAGATGTAYSVASTTMDHAGTYEVLVVNAYGSVRSQLAEVWLTLVDSVGDGSLGQREIPGDAREIRALAAGLWHTLAVRSDGKVLAWGYNQQGQCNVPGELRDVVAVAAGGYHSLALRSDGRVVGWGANSLGQARPPAGLSNVVAIAAGLWHSLALTEDGRVVAWGDNGTGQTSVPVGLSNVVAIAAGGAHSLALLRNGRVIAWGDNRNAQGAWSGQAQPPPTATNIITIAAGGYHSLAVRADGRVIAWGDNSRGQVSVPSAVRDVVAVSAGLEHSIALTRNGTAIAWGDNRWGQGEVPAGGPLAWVSAGGYHSVFLFDPPMDPCLVRYGRTGSRFMLWLQGWPRQRYVLEYKDRLEAASWVALPAVPGRAGLVGLEDPGPLPVRRFYRVRVE